MKEINNESRAVSIRMEEKAPFTGMMVSDTKTCNAWAAVINTLFASYADYIGSTVNVVVPEGSGLLQIPNTIESRNVTRPFVSLTLYFQPTVGDPGSATFAFEALGSDADRSKGPIARAEEYEKRFSHAKKFQLSPEGESGLEDYILPYNKRNNWKKTSVAEFEKSDRMNPHARVINCTVNNMDINACFSEIYGSTIETEIGTQNVEYRAVVDSMSPKTGEWLIRVDQGNRDRFTAFAVETGLSFTNVTSDLGIVPVQR